MSAELPTGQWEVGEIIRQVALQALGGEESVSRSYTAVGVVAIEDQCGELVVTVDRVWRTTDGVNEVRGPDACDRGDLAVDVSVILARCIDVAEGPKAAAAKVETISPQYKRAMDDADAIFNALDGALPSELWEKVALSQSTTNVTGGGIIVETLFSVALGVMAWCQ